MSCQNVSLQEVNPKAAQCGQQEALLLLPLPMEAWILLMAGLAGFHLQAVRGRKAQGTEQAQKASAHLLS